MVVRHNQPIPEPIVQNVRLLPIVDRFRDRRLRVSKRLEVQSSFPWLKVKSWSWSLPWNITVLLLTRWFRDRRETSSRIFEVLDQANADALVCLGNGNDPQSTIQFGKQKQIPCMLLLQSNSDVDERYFQDDNFVNAFGEPASACRFVLENVEMVVGQTQWQSDLVSRVVERSAEHLPTPVDSDSWQPSDSGSREFVLWIGRYDRFHKRPELAFQIAQLCPSLKFIFVINECDPEVEAELRQKVPENAEVVDYVRKDEMPALMRDAKVFLSTGSADFEGLPNVFLEAASSGTPIVSLNDFGEFISNSSGGFDVGDDVEIAADRIKLLCDDTAIWRQHSDSGRDWISKHHAIDPVIEQFKRLIEKLLA